MKVLTIKRHNGENVEVHIFNVGAKKTASLVLSHKGPEGHVRIYNEFSIGDATAWAWVAELIEGRTRASKGYKL